MPVKNECAIKNSKSCRGIKIKSVIATIYIKPVCEQTQIKIEF